MGRAERIEEAARALVAYFDQDGPCKPHFYGGTVDALRAALALPADDAACCDVPGVNILDGRCANCGGEMRQGHPNPTPRAEAAPSSLGVQRMTWTKERPTVPGWYFRRYALGGTGHLVCVYPSSRYKCGLAWAAADDLVCGDSDAWSPMIADAAWAAREPNNTEWSEMIADLNGEPCDA